MFSKFNLWRKKEGGFTSAAIFILGLPLIVGAFGLGFDSMRAVYIHQFLSARADLATQTAVTMLYTNNTNSMVYIGTKAQGFNAAVTAADDLYSQNTASKRGDGTGGSFLMFQSGSNGNPVVTQVGNPIPVAMLCSNSNAARYGVNMKVAEEMPTTFMKILGIEKLNLEIESESIVRPKTC